MKRSEVYGFEMIHTEEIDEIMQRERALLIDLRGEERYQSGHIKYARNFPIAYIGEWQEEIPEWMSLILYCESGNQSLLAARKLRGRKGGVYTLIGGYQAYLKANEKD